MVHCIGLFNSRITENNTAGQFQMLLQSCQLEQIARNRLKTAASLARWGIDSKPTAASQAKVVDLSKQ
jgi:hypothetical protein